MAVFVFGLVVPHPLHDSVVEAQDSGVELRDDEPNLKRLREEFAPREAALPQVTVEIPAASVYDALLEQEEVPA